MKPPKGGSVAVLWGRYHEASKGWVSGGVLGPVPRSLQRVGQWQCSGAGTVKPPKGGSVAVFWGRYREASKGWVSGGVLGPVP